MVWKYLWSSSTQEITTSKDGEAIVSTRTASMELREENITVVTEDVTSVTSSAPLPADAQPPVRKRRISIRQTISFPKFASSQNKLESPQPTPQPPKDAPPPPAPVGPAETKPLGRVRRLSIQAFSPRSKSTPVQPKQTTSSPPTSSPIPAVSVPKESIPAQPAKQNLSRADRQAQKSAQRLQILITGDTGVASPLVSPVTAKNRVDKIKSQLSNPTSGNRVIAELRKLPALGHGPKCDAPIHAVCLEHTDAEEDALHFSKLRASNGDVGIQDATSASSPVDKMAAVLQDMRIIDLVTAPDLGIGQPGDGKGLLAGAVPTAETVLNGVKQITPQLMALGYATGQMITPDHTSVYPPTDRISVLTYWWGMELLLPPPTLHYLETVQSITGSIVNFLSAMALVNNGVREILPLVRYIAQFVDLEYKSIKAQDKGKGVVCAATWLMPAALVPRPWDFPDPPSEAEPAAAAASSKALTAGDDVLEEKTAFSPPKIDNTPPSQAPV